MCKWLASHLESRFPTCWPMLFASLPPPFRSLRTPHGRPQTAGPAVLGGPWGTAWGLGPVTPRGDSPLPGQPHRSQSVEGVKRGGPGPGSPLGTPHGARWPDEAPHCSPFHNSLMKWGSKGHQPSILPPPLLRRWETEAFCRLLCSPVGESNQPPRPLGIPGGKPKLEAHFSPVSLGSGHMACLVSLPKRI